VLAAANLLSFSASFSPPAPTIAYGHAQAHAAVVFLLVAVLTWGDIYLVLLLPDSLLRFVLWCATIRSYRNPRTRSENVPPGGALSSAPVSWVDAVLLLRRPIDRCGS